MIALPFPSFPIPRLRGGTGALYDGSIRGTYGTRRGGATRQKMAFQSKQSMTSSQDRTDAVQGIEGVLLANRDRIVRFLQVRGAGDAAEDVFQDLWMRRMEVASLKLYDLDFERGTLMVRLGKGKKDRHIPVSSRCLEWRSAERRLA